MGEKTGNIEISRLYLPNNDSNSYNVPQIILTVKDKNHYSVEGENS
jgi:hypothetical protein